MGAAVEVRADVLCDSMIAELRKVYPMLTGAGYLVMAKPVTQPNAQDSGCCTCTRGRCTCAGINPFQMSI
jgi:hypothetical protein